jgi:hypothetical protein
MPTGKLFYQHGLGWAATVDLQQRSWNRFKQQAFSGKNHSFEAAVGRIHQTGQLHLRRLIRVVA